jgi:Tfp pilus assembly protein PilF
MKAPLVLAVLLFAAGAARPDDTPGSSPFPPQPSVQERLAKARKAVERQDWGTAQRELNVALREAPQNADVHNLLGYTYRKRPSADMAKAFEHYNAALRLDPVHKGAHEYIGEAYLIKGQLPEAERHLTELQRICGGPACEEYRDLARSIADYKAKQ